ncbi:hypothetical protein RI367_002361 [Sorochytrium milnesiophthora]
MIKPKALAEVLSQACTGGVHTALIANNEGSLLSFSGSSERDAHVHAAIAANVLNIYDKNNKSQVGGVKSMTVELEKGKILTLKLSPTLTLSLIANDEVELGLLRAKGLALQKYLEEPMKSIS